MPILLEELWPEVLAPMKETELITESWELITTDGTTIGEYSWDALEIRAAKQAMIGRIAGILGPLYLICADTVEEAEKVRERTRRRSSLNCFIKKYKAGHGVVIVKRAVPELREWAEQFTAELEKLILAGFTEMKAENFQAPTRLLDFSKEYSMACEDLQRWAVAALLHHRLPYTSKAQRTRGRKESRRN